MGLEDTVLIGSNNINTTVYVIHAFSILTFKLIDMKKELISKTYIT
jgi:hypothetical protein